MMTPYERVKLSRERTATTFPLPTPRDCIRYAITELAEYDDALLRIERTGDLRNNARQPDPRAELGQCVYMLLSAYVQLDEEPAVYHEETSKPERWMLKFSYYDAMASLAMTADDVLSSTDVDVPVYERSTKEVIVAQADEAYNSLLMVAESHGWDMTSLVEDTCVAFESKHGTVVP